MQVRESARRALVGVFAAAWSPVVVFCALPSLPVRGDVITSWNQYLLDNAIREDNKNPNPPGQPVNPYALGDKPPVVSRQMAMIHLAMFDAVNAVERRYQSYAPAPAANDPAYAGANAELAAIWAAHDVSMALFQNSNPVILSRIQSKTNTDLVDPKYANLSQGALDASKALGQFAAQQILTMRANDHATDVVNYPDDPANPGSTTTIKTFGHYRMDQFSNGAQLPVASPQWANVTPFAMTSGSQFRPAGPPAFTSKAYADAVNLTRTLGDKRRYDPAQYPGGKLPADVAHDLRTAFFWAGKGLSADGTKTQTGTTTPVGQWNEIATAAIGNKQMDLADSARLYALMNIGLADAAITAWNTKYTYDLWRPIHAIRLAATDPSDPNYNPDLQPAAGDSSWANWLPMIPTSNHPEYISGHSTFSGAAAEILTGLLGQNGIQFTITGDDALLIDANGLPDPNGTKEYRTYTSFWDAAEEAGHSRILGGIHYQFSNLDGLAAGKNVGDWVLAGMLAPVPEPGTVGMLLGVAGLAGLGRPRRRRVR
jgi:hypothetical protein